MPHFILRAKEREREKSFSIVILYFLDCNRIIGRGVDYFFRVFLKRKKFESNKFGKSDFSIRVVK